MIVPGKEKLRCDPKTLGRPKPAKQIETTTLHSTPHTADRPAANPLDPKKSGGNSGHPVIPNAAIPEAASSPPPRSGSGYRSKNYPQNYPTIAEKRR